MEPAGSGATWPKPRSGERGDARSKRPRRPRIVGVNQGVIEVIMALELRSPPQVRLQDSQLTPSGEPRLRKFRLTNARGGEYRSS
jgi:hypothetical protein